MSPPPTSEIHSATPPMEIDAGPNTAIPSISMHVSMNLISEPHEENAFSTDEDDNDGGGASIHYSQHDEDTDMTVDEHIASSLADALGSSEAQLEAYLEVAAAESEHAFTNIMPTNAMSQLSQQLEQIQEAQGNEAGMGLPGHIESVHFSSIPPQSPPFTPSYLSLLHNTPHIPYPYVGVSQNVAHSVQGFNAQVHPPPVAEMQNATASDNGLQLHGGITFNIGPGPPGAFWQALTQEPENWDELFSLSNANFTMVPQVDVDQNTYTLSMYDFLWSWGHRASRAHMGNKRKAKGPELGSLDRQRRDPPKQVRRCDLQGDECDMQGMNWLDMEVTRREAREARHRSYKNYESIRYRPPYYSEHIKSKSQPMLPNVDNFLRFRRMDLQHKPHLSHFQLRNLIACSSRSNVFYAGKHKVHYSNPLMGTTSTIMDLTDPDFQPTLNVHPAAGGVQISTIASRHDILIAGGFNGEYSMINLNSSKTSSPVQGVITDHLNSITNHISLSLSRSSGLPQAAFASNDNGIRVLDCTTNTFQASHTYSFPVNCTAISPDSRLRVVVGDTKMVHICDAESGNILQELEGHNDFGFACAWADNGWHVATGNQDMTVKIWDARMWTDRYGAAKPLRTIGSELAGVRSLQFSPLGSGKRILLACEAADILDVIDGESYESKQVLDFFGEIGGACFTPDGQDIFVANCDGIRGGIIEFERTGEGARLEYRTTQEDVDEVNYEISRRETRAWLNVNEEHDGSQFKSFTIEKPKKPSPHAIAYARNIAEAHGLQWEQIFGAATDDDEIMSMVSSFEEDVLFGKTSVPRHVPPSKKYQPIQHQRKRLGWDADGDEDMDDVEGGVEEDVEYDFEDEGYTSIEEQMRQQARGYDWRQTDSHIVADSRSNDRTQTWRRTKHLFGTGNSEPIGGMTFLGGDRLDLGL